MSDNTSLKEKIRQLMVDEGFDVCGFCDANALDSEKKYLKNWINQGFNGTMHYMKNHFEKRVSPKLLVPDAQTVIVAAQNYFPQQTLTKETPSVAKFAYGKDYHKVIKDKLHKIVAAVAELKNDSKLRIFVDSAPLLERALAVKAGLGFIGKNGCLIIPNKGSFFFLGEIVTSIALPPDKPFEKSFCGNCTRCLDACPTKALIAPKVLNAQKCNSYLTIEYQGETFPNKPTGNFFFGCDICQDVCPHNRFSKPHHETEFLPKQELISMKQKDWDLITPDEFNTVFKDSPLKRAGLEKIKASIKEIEKSKLLDK